MIIAVTGTHKGLGKRIAEYFLDRGDIVVGCSRHKGEIRHENYKHYVADVCNESQVTKFVRDVRKDLGYIDVLINNAGIASMNHFLMTPMETARKLMEVNYFGSLICIRAFLNLLKKAEHPRIINFSTVAVPLCLEGEMAYASSKAAIENLTRILAKEISRFGITVNAVGPTPIKTDLIAKVPEEKLKKILDNQAIHRFGTIEDVINVIEFFVNSNSDFVTGQVVYLGGITR